MWRVWPARDAAAAAAGGPRTQSAAADAPGDAAATAAYGTPPPARCGLLRPAPPASSTGITTRNPYQWASLAFLSKIQILPIPTEQPPNS